MSQRVLFSENPPDFILPVWTNVFELIFLQFLEFTYQSFINNEILFAIHAWRFVLMSSYTWFEEFRHFQMWIAKQGWYSNNRGYNLSKKRAVAVAYQ